MADRDHEATIRLNEDEVPLVTFLATTAGVHLEPAAVLGTLDLEEQIRVMRDVAKALRITADKLEARAGLAEAVDDVEEAMRP